MMATNDPIWLHMPAAYDPIIKRCEYVHMTRSWNNPVYFMKTKDKDILRYVLHKMYKWCFPDGYDSYSREQDFHAALEDIALNPMDSVEQWVSNMN